MKIGPYQFEPRLQFSVIYAALGTLMLLLGFWQLQRADEKIHLQLMVEQAGKKAPIDILSVDLSAPQALYTRVMLVGSFQSARQFLWDNRIYNGSAGYEVVTPFRLAATGQLVLVNRGWIPLGPSREVLPDATFGTTEESSINGIWSRPSIGFSGGDAVDLDGDEWPRLLQHFAYQQIAQALGEPILPGLVQVLRTPSRTAQAVGQALTPEDGNVPLYRDNWQPVAFGPQRHYGYAFQWFAMFTALTVIFVVMNTQKISYEQDR